MKRMTVVLALLTLALSLPPAAAQEATPTPARLTPADLADPDGQFVEVNGASVYYVARGPQDGPPVLLLHGFLGSTPNWDRVIDVLAEAGYRAVAFDRPPFGLSSKSPNLDYSLKAQAALTAGFMDALGIERAAIVGHSAGGLVAARLAVDYPERVEKLALVSAAIGLSGADFGLPDGQTSSGAPPVFANADPNNPLAQIALRAFFTTFAENLLSSSYYDPTAADRRQAERSGRFLRLAGWEAGLLAFNRDAAGPDSQFDLEALRGVTAPALLIWGEEDGIVPLRVGERLREYLPDAAWIVYPRVGHIPMDENTDAFNADLLAFLEG